MEIKNGDFVVDGTVGGGGHSKEIIKSILPDGLFLGIDLDGERLKETSKEILNDFPGNQKQIIFSQGNYKNALKIIQERNLPKANGVIIDLGFSSFQINDPSRGFSFLKDSVLDMRYDITSGKPAWEFINKLSEKELADIFYQYGEEGFSRRIASAIVFERRNKNILRTSDLADVVYKAVPAFYRKRKIHPATKVFQALRIFVNDELGNVKEFLSSSKEIFSNSGRLAIITFHSLEDRIVKNAFKDFKKEGIGEIINKKVIKPSWDEIKSNPRSRSAKLRVFQFN